MANTGMDIRVSRDDVVMISVALTFAADHASKPSEAWELLKLKDRIQGEWNTEMRARKR